MITCLASYHLLVQSTQHGTALLHFLQHIRIDILSSGRQCDYHRPKQAEDFSVDYPHLSFLLSFLSIIHYHHLDSSAAMTSYCFSASGVLGR